MKHPTKEWVGQYEVCPYCRKEKYIGGYWDSYPDPIEPNVYLQVPCNPLCNSAYVSAEIPDGGIF